MPQVVVYRYDTSPFSVKVDHILALKHIPHHRVNVSPALPRPEITELLGITYRRIPILALGNDVYCDTSLIASVLERRFSSDQYRTLFPLRRGTDSKDTGLIKAFSKYYADVTLFPLATRQLPWDKFPEPFIQDRSKFLGAPIQAKKLVALQPEGLSLLSAHIALVEEQLQDGRDWLFDTVTPSLADISVHFIFSWIPALNKTALETFNNESCPKTWAWLSRMKQFLNDEKAKLSISNLSGQQAAELICGSELVEPVGLDQTQLNRLGLEAHQTVSVAPEDTATTYATIGKLVGLNKEEVVLEVQGSVGRLRCHFPRLGFKITRANQNKL